MSMTSQMYFLMGVDVGNLLVRKLIAPLSIALPTMLFFTYCGAQTSFEIRNWEVRAKDPRFGHPHKE